jgi:hypothetical protein
VNGRHGFLEEILQTTRHRIYLYQDSVYGAAFEPLSAAPSSQRKALFSHELQAVPLVLAVSGGGV